MQQQNRNITVVSICVRLSLTKLAGNTVYKAQFGGQPACLVAQYTNLLEQLDFGSNDS